MTNNFSGNSKQYGRCFSKRWKSRNICQLVCFCCWYHNFGHLWWRKVSNLRKRNELYLCRNIWETQLVYSEYQVMLCETFKLYYMIHATRWMLCSGLLCLLFLLLIFCVCEVMCLYDIKHYLQLFLVIFLMGIHDK